MHEKLVAVTIGVAWTFCMLVAAVAEPLQQAETGSVFKDCEDCPSMVIIPAGEYVMGSAETEVGRLENEGPLHKVVISKSFAVSTFEITRAQYARFITDADHESGNQCTVWTGKRPGETIPGKNWEDPNFPQGNDHPVVCISWPDAKAYVKWLSNKTGESYRLLAEAEWEYAARAGTNTRRYFGDDDKDICQFANVPDQSARRAVGEGVWKYTDCDDGYADVTAPVGSFKPNAYGLYDMLGDVWEWTEDCYHNNYHDAPTDGSAWLSGSCEARVVRGASLSAPVSNTRSASRYKGVIEIPGDKLMELQVVPYHNFNLGLRVARTVD